jgi:hypothetical protein
MKAILYIVAILAICGAAGLSLVQSNKLKAIESERLSLLAKDKEIVASTNANDVEIKKEKELLKKSQDDKELVSQSVAALTSIGTSLSNDVSRLNDESKEQELEFAALDKALNEVNEILAGLGGDVTLDTLSEKIVQIDNDKKEKQLKLEELGVLISGADKTVASSRAEAERLTKKIAERNSRMQGNGMQAVVTAVNQDWGFLVIGAGSNSGFTPQTSLLVERDGRMLGRVRPSSIEPNQTIAEIDLGSLATGVRLQPGDRVILAKTAVN